MDGPSDCQSDCSPGNAFEHAFINCVATKRCGSALAKELWDLHEQQCPEIVPNCTTSSMDLHNNNSGRGAGGNITEQEVTDCIFNSYASLDPATARDNCYLDLCLTEVLESMGQGDLIWPSPPANPINNCPACGGTNGWDTDYDAGDDCPTQ